jgi:KDO2-lipid IV(A) lauroyltransferase
MARARGNLARAFPDCGPREVEDLVKATAAAAGDNLFHALAAGRLLDRATFTEKGPSGLSLARTVADLQKHGQGVFFLTGHIGSWELLGAYAARQFDREGLGRLGVVTGTLRNPPIDRLVQERRRKLGLVPLPRDEGLRPVLKHLDQEGLVAFLLDQNTRTRNLDVPFFGRPAPTPVAMAQLALKRGLPVLPLAMIPEGGGFTIHWLAPLVPREDELEEFLARCNAALEELIRRNPAQWVWFHERWHA